LKGKKSQSNFLAFTFLLLISLSGVSLILDLQSSQSIPSTGFIRYLSQPPDFARDLHKVKYQIITTSDWTNLRLSSDQTHVVVISKVTESSNASGLTVQWDNKSVRIYKRAYDTSEVSIEFTLLLTGLRSNSTIVYNITKGSIGYTVVVVYNFNDVKEFAVANKTNSISGSTENPFIFDVDANSLIAGGPLKIEFNKQMKKVLAFYYPWYGTHWGPQGCWRGWGGYGHNPDNFIDGRRDTATAHYPLFDVYDSWDVSLINYHLQCAKEGAIDVFISSWMGVDHQTDTALRYILNQSLSMDNISITVLYETKKTINMVNEEALRLITDELSYILNQYSDVSSFFKIDGKPVIFIYAADLFSMSNWTRVLNEVKKSKDAIFVADTWNLEYLWIFDGLFKYIPVQFEEAILRSRYELTSLYTHAWKLLTGDSSEKIFIASVFPGYDDTKIRTPGIYISREGDLFYEKSWNIALSSAPDWVTITSFNEWKEGTEIEPSIEYDWHYIIMTKSFSKNFKSE
jgi:hypothetical protein